MDPFTTLFLGSLFFAALFLLALVIGIVRIIKGLREVISGPKPGIYKVFKELVPAPVFFSLSTILAIVATLVLLF